MKCNPVPIGHQCFINFRKLGNITLTVSRKNNGVDLRQNFKDGFRHTKNI